MKRHAKRFLKKMRPPHDRKIFWPAGLLFLVVAALLALSLEAGGPRFSPASDLPSPIGIEGELSRGGGKWEKLTADTPFDTDERHTIRIRGHFDREIPAGEELLFHVRHLFVSLRINGREVWENYTSPRPSFSASPGITWGSVPLPGLGVEDEVELVMENAYKGVIPSFRDLLDHMQTGRSSQLYARMLGEEGVLSFASLAVIFLGLTSLILAFLARLFRPPARRNSMRSRSGPDTPFPTESAARSRLSIWMSFSKGPTAR